MPRCPMCGGLTSGGRHLTAHETAAIRAEATRETRGQHHAAAGSSLSDALRDENPMANRSVTLDSVGRLTASSAVDTNKGGNESLGAAESSFPWRALESSDKREADTSGVSYHW